MKFLKSTLASILGSLIAGGILIFFIFVIIGGILTPPAPELEIEDKAFLFLDLKKEIKEQEDSSPFRSQGLGIPGIGGTDGLYELRKAIDFAKKDEKIGGIYLRTRGLNAGWATVSAVREALLEFKKSGKPIYAWSDVYNEKSYFLSSVAENTSLHPYGSFELNGFGVTPYYLRGLFDKIGIKPQIFKVGTYKSAIEPYRDYEMSEASRRQTSELLMDIWAEFTNSVHESRKDVSQEQIDLLATSAKTLFHPQAAVDLGLLEGLRFENDVLEEMKEKITSPKNEALPMVKVGKYLAAKVAEEENNAGLDKVAVLFMEGGIVGGNGNDGEIGGDKYVAELRKIKLDSSIKAVVLRINSPGGSALASDLIWAEIEALKKVKPVIASMGDVAASGGYYIATPCDKIFARATTITGSIGVFSLMFNTQSLMEEKIGIHYDRVVTHPMADIGNNNRKLSEAEIEVWQTGVNQVYSRFVNIVQTGRNFPDSVAVDSIAQGRVWSGTRAKALGLVDELGGLDDAIDYAAKAASMDEFQVVRLPEAAGTFEKLAKSLAFLKVDATLLAPELQEKVKLVLDAQKNNWQAGTYMRMPIELDIQ